MGRNVCRADFPSVDMSTFGISAPPDRVVYLAGEIDEKMSTQIVAQIFTLVGQDNRRPIQLVMSTYGGCIDDMFMLYDSLQFLPCPVHTIGIGKVMSAGVLLLACGTKGHRQMGSNARVMLHSIRGGIGGNIFEIMNEVEEMKRQQGQLTSLLTKHTKMSKDVIETLMGSGRDKYITAQEAVSLGIVDSIMTDKEIGRWQRS